ncbi:MAG: TlpA family protein disulfide reductase [Candidatus Marinimicrobia bacterium]|nr:TlpA family protein disulfide reductase [Candidatus Neomarinimicrobiota bacterium]
MKIIFPLIICFAISFTQAVAPTFFLPTLKGDHFFASEHYGEEAKDSKMTVISFFATWCGPCQKEIKTLESFSKKYTDVNFYLINYMEEEAVILKWLEKMETDLPILLDRYGLIAEKFDGVISQNAGKKAAILPALFVIDKNGVITYSHSGFENKAAEYLETILRTYDE